MGAIHRPLIKIRTFRSHRLRLSSASARASQITRRPGCAGRSMSPQGTFNVRPSLLRAPDLGSRRKLVPRDQLGRAPVLANVQLSLHRPLRFIYETQSIRCRFRQRHGVACHQGYSFEAWSRNRLQVSALAALMFKCGSLPHYPLERVPFIGALPNKAAPR